MEILSDEADRPEGARLTAPEQYTAVGTVAAAEVAACLGLDEQDISIEHHLPTVGSVGLPFILAELASLEALGASRCEGPRHGL